MSQNSSLIMSTKRLALVHLTVQDGKRNNGELCKISDQCQLACARALLTLCISTIIYFTRVIHIQSFVLIMKTKFICCWLVSSGAIAILFEARLRRSRLFYYWQAKRSCNINMCVQSSALIACRPARVVIPVRSPSNAGRLCCACDWQTGTTVWPTDRNGSDIHNESHWYKFKFIVRCILSIDRFGRLQHFSSFLLILFLSFLLSHGCSQFFVEPTKKSSNSVM